MLLDEPEPEDEEPEDEDAEPEDEDEEPPESALTPLGESGMTMSALIPRVVRLRARRNSRLSAGSWGLTI